MLQSFVIRSKSLVDQYNAIANTSTFITMATIHIVQLAECDEVQELR